MITLLRGGDLYDPEPRGRGDLLLAGGRIAALGDGLSDAPSGWPVEEVDVSGLLVVPGLVDTHTHMTGGGGEGGAHTRVPPLFVEQLTRAGVTTAIGLLGTDGTTRSLAELLASARGLAHYGLTALTYTGGYEVPPPTLTGSVRGDLVHVDRMVAVGELAISDHRSAQPTLNELLRIAADAHVSGLMTGKAGLVHLHLGDGPRGLSLVREALAVSELPPRVFHPTHCNRNRRLWEEAKDCAPWASPSTSPPSPKKATSPAPGRPWRSGSSAACPRPGSRCPATAAAACPASPPTATSSAWASATPEGSSTPCARPPPWVSPFSAPWPPAPPTPPRCSASVKKASSPQASTPTSPCSPRSSPSGA
ncbi:MAG: beta-aspartyl-peptidase [Deltaproteobacteria bacterium]|nr:beta-aspartyl-peptidase [Deltaproteobacteria bacterium]